MAALAERGHAFEDAAVGVAVEVAAVDDLRRLLNASFWTRIDPSTLRSASRLCGSVRSAAATALSAMTTA
jgi:hypothetical protein